MTFSLGDRHDKAYECQCGHFGKREHPSILKETWTCIQCHDPLLVYMDDGDGGRFIVKRYPAHQVGSDEKLVYCNNLVLALGYLTESNPVEGRSQDANWHFFIRGYRPVTVPRDQYVNVYLKNWPVQS